MSCKEVRRDGDPGRREVSGCWMRLGGERWTATTSDGQQVRMKGLSDLGVGAQQ